MKDADKFHKIFKNVSFRYNYQHHLGNFRWENEEMPKKQVEMENVLWTNCHRRDGVGLRYADLIVSLAEFRP